jgi:excisionase family DNA binding protein
MLSSSRWRAGTSGASDDDGTSERERRMLIPQNALRVLRRRTGGDVSLATFYRWVNSGKLQSVRVGARILIPWPALDDFIRKCYNWD